MNRALELADRLDEKSIIAMHEALLGDTNPEWTGHWRTEQVRIGGMSVQGVRFVPPDQDRVPAAMTDLVKFIHRLDFSTFEQGAEADADSNPCGTGYQGATKGGLFISSATEEIGYQQQNDESTHCEPTPQRRAHHRSVDLGLRPADSRTGRSSSANVRRARRRT